METATVGVHEDIIWRLLHSPLDFQTLSRVTSIKTFTGMHTTISLCRHNIINLSKFIKASVAKRVQYSSDSVFPQSKIETK